MSHYDSYPPLIYSFYTVIFLSLCFFFFQAEDGIRDLIVTGVQTCALPIYLSDLFLNAINDGQSIHAVAHDDNSTNGFPFTLPLGNTFTNVRPERNCSQITDEDWRAVLG